MPDPDNLELKAVIVLPSMERNGEVHASFNQPPFKNGLSFALADCKTAVLFDLLVVLWDTYMPAKLRANISTFKWPAPMTAEQVGETLVALTQELARRDLTEFKLKPQFRFHKKVRAFLLSHQPSVMKWAN